jgi:hypothetical protein
VHVCVCVRARRVGRWEVEGGNIITHLFKLFTPRCNSLSSLCCINVNSRLPIRYSMRTTRWRYTEWALWNGTTLKPEWQLRVTGPDALVELYDHDGDTGVWRTHRSRYVPSLCTRCLPTQQLTSTRLFVSFVVIRYYSVGFQASVCA